MRIAVGIPSYREAANIAHVVRCADLGLISLARPDDCLVVNLDSGSDDGTAEAFLATPTTVPKQSHIISPANRGKGRNLLRFFELCVDGGFDVAITLDADVTSTTPGWIEALAGPILRGDAGFVAPAYRRHRFDGSTTNLFAFPFAYAWTGALIRQPIGGDFALSLPLVRHLLRQPLCASVFQYGIDIFMTLGAALFDGRVTQVPLGSKLHTASFDHFETVAREVIAGAAVALQGQAGPSPASGDLALTDAIDPGGVFWIRDAARECFERRRDEVLAKRDTIQRWLPQSFDALIEAVEPERPSLGAAPWTCAVAEAFLCEARARLDPEALADLLVPLLVLRTVTFWEHVESLDPPEVEAEVLEGARLMREAILDHAALAQ